MKRVTGIILGIGILSTNLYAAKIDEEQNTRLEKIEEKFKTIGPDPKVTERLDMQKKVIYQVKGDFETEISNLKKEIGALQKSNMGVIALSTPMVQPVRSPTAEEKASAVAEKISKFDISGLLEFQATSGRTFELPRSSNITVATAELDSNVHVNDMTTATLNILYEEGVSDDHRTLVDKAFLHFEKEGSFFYSNIGLDYIPFGVSDSGFITDPLQLTLTETQKTNVTVGALAAGFDFKLYAFKGTNTKPREQSTVNGWGSRLDYNYEKADHLKVLLGVDFTNNFDDLGIIQSKMTSGSDNKKDIKAWGLHTRFDLRDFYLVGEYIRPSEFHTDNFTFKNGKAQMAVYQIEAGHTCAKFSKEFTLRVGYQGAKEAVQAGLSETRMLFGATVALMPQVDLHLEHYQGKDYGVSDGGTGKKDYAETIKVSASF